MRDWAKEKEARTAWIKRIIEESGAKGVVFGNSGGKDCALTGILCKAACPEKTIGVIMPCESKQNYTSDSEDAKRLADKFGIETRTVDITEAKRALTSAARHALNAADAETVKKSTANVNPRLRMTTLYLIAQTEGCLVAGTGNRSLFASRFCQFIGFGCNERVRNRIIEYVLKHLFIIASRLVANIHKHENMLHPSGGKVAFDKFAPLCLLLL